MLEQVHLRRLESLYLPVRVKDADHASCLSAMFRIKDLLSDSHYLGPLAFNALSRRYGSLERLTLSGCSSATGDMIQAVLEACPVLIELTVLMIHADQIQSSRRDWVNVGLKKLVVFVRGMDARSTAEEQLRAVFAQPVRLTRLEPLVIGNPYQKWLTTFHGLDLCVASRLGRLASLARLTMLSFEKTRQDGGRGRGLDEDALEAAEGSARAI